MARSRCTVEGCGRVAFGHGYCNAHYKRWRKTGEPGPADVRGPAGLCTVADCTRPHRARGLCDSHYARWKLSGERPNTPLATKRFLGLVGPCLRPDCGEESRGSGYCLRHYARMRVLVNNYGLSWEEFDSLWETSQGKCRICQKTLEQDSKDTHVDHCHTSGAVRGLLCRHCNQGLGHFRDNPTYLAAAIEYLKEASSVCSPVLSVATRTTPPVVVTTTNADEA